MQARPISYQGVLGTFAYILMYELESPPYSRRNAPQKPRTPKPATVSAASEPSSSKSKPVANGIGYTSPKVYGPELPQNGLPKRNEAIPLPACADKDPLADSDGESKQRKATSQKKPSSDDQIVPLKTYENGTKLVPYDEDDSSSADEGSQVKEASGVWRVSTVAESPQEPSKGAGHKQNGATSSANDKVLNELFRMSHQGYSSMTTWEGNRSKLDKEAANERREERKRTIGEVGDSMDQGRKKHVKTHNNYKSNPGYNPIEVSSNFYLYNFHRKTTIVLSQNLVYNIANICVFLRHKV